MVVAVFMGLFRQPASPPGLLPRLSPALTPTFSYPPGADWLNQPSRSPAVTATPLAQEQPEAVFISAVSQGFGSSPGFIKLETRLKGGERANVSGWRIKTNGNEFIIPKAINLYNIFLAEALADIVLEPGHSVTIHFDISPIGKNFRLNQCTGYFNDQYKFEPALPNNCPVLQSSSYQHLAGWCQDYIRTIGSCELYDVNKVNSWGGDEGTACRQFVTENISMNRCFMDYSNKPDFLSKEWRVWAGTKFIDPLHDWIRLYNPDGRLIDEYIY